jgi:isocitrate dehydrogenase
MSDITQFRAKNGEAITIQNGKLHVPNNPVVPYVEGDGTGPDIWRASVRIFDAAIAKAYNGQRKIEWLEVLAGEKAFTATGNWLPDATVEAFNHYLVGNVTAAFEEIQRRSSCASTRTFTFTFVFLF